MTTPRKKKGGKKGGKKAVLQQDEYRAKPAGEPTAPEVGPGHERPKTWGELGTRVKRHLFNIAVGLVGVVDDAIDALRQMVRKTPEYVPEVIKSALIAPRISEAIAKRIERADKTEAKAQAAAVNQPPPAVEDAVDALTAILDRFKAQGLHVEILDVNGTPSPIVVRPELAEAARQLALSAAKVVAEVASPAGES
jgi:hypothetical protein